uniref:SH3 and multiple ankyrin repeat domains protein 3-like isoform X2 n=1 Tax=Halichoerus grypus TaxID=9711 RepID=UPI001659CB6B|nr:SH3 and multiple ankyrin repeat domains protein 3-like isoform X2 [Halichoerus grypus]
MQEAGTGALELLKFPWQLSPGHPSFGWPGSSARAARGPGASAGLRGSGARQETPTAHSPPELGLWIAQAALEAPPVSAPWPTGAQTAPVLRSFSVGPSRPTPLKCIRFNPDATVWVAKQRILCSLTQSLKDVLNYGLFQPASNGRDGKFLDEERLLREYPQPVGKGVPSLEFRYKKRVYKQSNLDEKQLAKLHTKTNLKKFMDHIQHRSVEKIVKMLERGLDPNFHDLDTGETPLTLAAQLDDPAEVIKALRNGGAHLDFRARDGMTALHKAARARNQVALKTLLELGASPDYKDSYGLTPLYHTAIVGGDPYCCELLLHEHATVCCRDENGWHEVHQACKYGHVQHLEHLLFYGADMAAQNASGNTALHICALYNQDSCARVLLFRGGNKEQKNHNSQTPFQVGGSQSQHPLRVRGRGRPRGVPRGPVCWTRGGPVSRGTSPAFGGCVLLAPSLLRAGAADTFQSAVPCSDSSLWGVGEGSPGKASLSLFWGGGLSSLGPPRGLWSPSGGEQPWPSVGRQGAPWRGVGAKLPS